MTKTFFLLLFAIASISMSAQTYYYRQIAKVSNGIRSAGNNSGQFITFTKDGCYDSNKNGISVNNGFQNYKIYENGIYYYLGGSYWGSQCQYCFNAAKNRLNIIPDNETGIIYVYQRVNAPVGIKTCYYIKNNSNGGKYYSSSPSSVITPTPHDGQTSLRNTIAQQENLLESARQVLASQIARGATSAEIRSSQDLIQQYETSIAHMKALLK